MWIFCGGMVRSGSTLQYQVVSEIVERSGKGRRLGWLEPGGFENCKGHVEGNLEFKVLKTHELTDDIKDEFDSGNAVSFYVYRDIRDVTASLIKFRGKQFRQTYRRIPAILDTHNAFVSLSPCCISRYEHFLSHLPQEVGRYAAFLNIDLSETEIRAIAGKLTIDNQIKITSNTISGPDGKGLPSTGSGEVFCPHTLLHPGHISEHKGKIGRYRDDLSQEEIELIENNFGSWLKEHGYCTQCP